MGESALASLEPAGTRCIVALSLEDGSLEDRQWTAWEANQANPVEDEVPEEKSTRHHYRASDSAATSAGRSFGSRCVQQAELNHLSLMPYPLAMSL